MGRSWSLLCCAPLTGRTHQIRLHVAHMGYPIASDNLYGLQVIPTFWGLPIYLSDDLCAPWYAQTSRRPIRTLDREPATRIIDSALCQMRQYERLHAWTAQSTC